MNMLTIAARIIDRAIPNIPGFAATAISVAPLDTTINPSAATKLAADIISVKKERRNASFASIFNKSSVLVITRICSCQEEQQDLVPYRRLQNL